MAGLAAARGSFTLFEALAWTTAGSVVGAFALYALGAGSASIASARSCDGCRC
jgi:membrane protein DedA with SNARE-associated domain